jgi:hypothetical protein
MWHGHPARVGGAVGGKTLLATISSRLVLLPVQLTWAGRPCHATAQYDKEFVAMDEGKPLSAAQKVQHAKARRRARPKFRGEDWPQIKNQMDTDEIKLAGFGFP